MLLDLSLANKKTLFDINEPAMRYEYRSKDFLIQQLSIKHLNVDVHHDNNALAELNDCTEGLLHLGLCYI